uniref:Uncharacterized protein n=1 Tax=Ditylenchus dipsaci TaxID=166011 RepID=A0A915EUD1_9BILA
MYPIQWQSKPNGGRKFTELRMKPEEVEVATPITSVGTEVEKEAQEYEELLHGYHDPDHHPADNGEEDGEQQKDEQEHRSATPEERRSPTPVEDVDWSPAPGEDEKPLTDLDDDNNDGAPLEQHQSVEDDRLEQKSEPVHTENVEEMNSGEHDHDAPERKSSEVTKKKKKSVASKKSNASSKLEMMTID